MKYFPNLSTLIIFLGVITIACSKSDPKPLGAQVNGVLLAGDKGKSKSWRLVQMTYATNGGALTAQSLPACFLDNVYTFNNNDAQDYTGGEGGTKCNSSNPSVMETGTWSFTLDGIILNVEVYNTQSPLGLFSSEIFTQGSTIFQAITPFPAYVQKLDASNMVLEFNETIQTSSYKYVLTFTLF